MNTFWTEQNYCNKKKLLIEHVDIVVFTYLNIYVFDSQFFITIILFGSESIRLYTCV